MDRVQNLANERLHDLQTNTEFTPVMDARTGQTLYVAETEGAISQHYDAIPGFKLLAEEEWGAICGRVRPVLLPVVMPAESTEAQTS